MFGYCTTVHVNASLAVMVLLENKQNKLPETEKKSREAEYVLSSEVLHMDESPAVVRC